MSPFSIWSFLAEGALPLNSERGPIAQRAMQLVVPGGKSTQPGPCSSGENRRHARRRVPESKAPRLSGGISQAGGLRYHPAFTQGRQDTNARVGSNVTSAAANSGASIVTPARAVVPVRVMTDPHSRGRWNPAGSFRVPGVIPGRPHPPLGRHPADISPHCAAYGRVPFSPRQEARGSSGPSVHGARRSSRAGTAALRAGLCLNRIATLSNLHRQCWWRDGNRTPLPLQTTPSVGWPRQAEALDGLSVRPSKRRSVIWSTA